MKNIICNAKCEMRNARKNIISTSLVIGVWSLVIIFNGCGQRQNENPKASATPSIAPSASITSSPSSSSSPTASSSSSASASASVSASPSPTNPLSAVHYWAYQIQDQNLNGGAASLEASHYDLLVIDQIRSIDGDTDYDSSGEVRALKNSNNSTGGKKIVVCYIDVGEAEDYRWYWQSGWGVGNPSWILEDDPDGWSGNYPVAFWDPEWLAIEKIYLDRIIADGYDGIYLDWLSGYDDPTVEAAAIAAGKNSRTELYNFVKSLHDYALAQHPDFLFIAQNATELYDLPGYMDLFDGVAQEAIWYDGAGDTNTGDTTVDAFDSDIYVSNLQKWQQAGKTVFNVEYSSIEAHSNSCYASGEALGFKTYVGLRLLKQLTLTPPPGY